VLRRRKTKRGGGSANHVVVLVDAEVVVDAERFGLVGSEGDGRGKVDAG